MKQLLLVACLLLASCAAAAADLSPAAARLSECLNAAAAAHGVPASLLVVLLKVEGGTLGKVSQNTNDTVDIGPMQVNVIWVPKLAARWKTTREAAHTALRDNLCANLEAGAWILRQALDTSGGDFWRGVGYYHSRTQVYTERYLRKVLAATRSLQAQAQIEARARNGDAAGSGAPSTVAAGR